VGTGAVALESAGPDGGRPVGFVVGLLLVCMLMVGLWARAARKRREDVQAYELNERVPEE
jgi:hypothetical protein